MVIFYLKGKGADLPRGYLRDWINSQINPNSTNNSSKIFIIGKITSFQGRLVA